MTKNNYPLFLFFFILVIWGLYRYVFHFSIWIDELLAKPFIYFIPTIYIVRILERRNLSSIGLVKTNLIKNIFIGIVLGIFISAEAILTKNIKYGHIVFNPDNLPVLSILGVYLLSLATGFTEEVVFRGYILTRFEQSFKNGFISIALSSILFVTVHFPIIIFVLKYSLSDLINYSMLILVLGILNGIVFKQTKSLTAPTVIHSLWDFSATIFR